MGFLQACIGRYVCIERWHEPPVPWSQEQMKIRQGAWQKGRMGSWQSSGISGLPLPGIGWWPFKGEVGPTGCEWGWVSPGVAAAKELRISDASFLLGIAFCKMPSSWECWSVLLAWPVMCLLLQVPTAGLVPC